MSCPNAGEGQNDEPVAMNNNDLQKGEDALM